MSRKANGEGTYTVLPSGKVRYRDWVEVDGVRQRKSFTASSKQAAKNAYKKYVASSGKVAIERVVYVKDWAYYWLDIYKKPNVAYKTYVDYKMYIDRHIVPSIGDKKIVEIKEAHIKQLLAGARTKPTKDEPEGHPLTRSAQEKLLWALEGIFRTAVENGYCAKDPTAKIKLGKPSPKKPSVFLREHMKVIVDAIATHKNGPYIGLYLYSGLRPGEGFGLMWSDDDPEKCVFHVRRSLSLTSEGYKVTPGLKSEPERIVAYNRALRPLLDKLPRNSLYILSRPVYGKGANGERVVVEYTHHTHETYKHIYRGFFADINAALPDDKKIPRLSPHKMRHTFATFLRKSGADLDEIREILGHKSVSTTQIYDTVDVDDMRGSVSKLQY